MFRRFAGWTRDTRRRELIAPDGTSIDRARSPAVIGIDRTVGAVISRRVAGSSRATTARR